jgi:hypothetical protein
LTAFSRVDAGSRRAPTGPPLLGRSAEEFSAHFSRQLKEVVRNEQKSLTSTAAGLLWKKAAQTPRMLCTREEMAVSIVGGNA